MGAHAAVEIDGWLREGGLVVASSERAARALAAACHRARQAEGRQAWPTPNILDWHSFVREAWQRRAPGDCLLLSPAQEQALWAAALAEDSALGTLLEAPLHRLAALASDAHSLLCAYAPRYLYAAARGGWQQDAGALSSWLTAFDAACARERLLSPSRLPLEVLPLLQRDSGPRPALMLAGFDRLLPTQRSLLDAWGGWSEAPLGTAAAKVEFHAAQEFQSELAACVHWCRQQLAAAPEARLLVVTQDARSRRGELERAFAQLQPPGSAPLFEFSLGVPLSQTALPRAALLLLRWLSQPLAEDELDWLLASQLAASPQESGQAQAYMRALRRRGLERTEWTLESFTAQQRGSLALPAEWLARLAAARALLERSRSQERNPLDWAELVPELLAEAGFAQGRSLQSAEYQALHRWQQAVESCGSLGFDARRISWTAFYSQLARTVSETLYAPESRDAPIQIAGPAESAALAASAIWFLGTDEDAWPANGATHPLLPPQVQREAAMPHATPQLDWELAAQIVRRLLASAPEVHFSYARQGAEGERRPSRLALQVAGAPKPLPATLPPPKPLTEPIVDTSRIPFPPGPVEGGAYVLTSQSNCPFKAFATARLAASGWEPAPTGLTAAQRGQLLHAVLHSIWAGPPDGLHSLTDLQRIEDRTSFAAAHVERVLQQEMPAAARALMPRRYLALEAERMTRLAAEWLQFESARCDFDVAATEDARTISLADLTLRLRLDRLDRLNDGSFLVVDYKTGNATPQAWELPRPADVQLPLYAVAALDREREPLGGLVFAKARPGNCEFAGRVGNAASTLLPALTRNTALVSKPMTAEMLLDWRARIEQLARDFIEGRAGVDPREPPETCAHCDLQSLCRIQETGGVLVTDEPAQGEAEAGDA